MGSTGLTFYFLCGVIFRGWIGLENSQNFLKNHIFLVLHVHKNDPVALVIRYAVDSVNVNMHATF